MGWDDRPRRCPAPLRGLGPNPSFSFFTVGSNPTIPRHDNRKTRTQTGLAVMAEGVGLTAPPLRAVLAAPSALADHRP